MPLSEVCSQELPYLAITSSAQTTRRASGNSADPWARGLASPTMGCISFDSTDTYTIRHTFGDSSSSHAQGWARQGTRRTFGGSSSSCARGLGATGHSACFQRLVWLPCLGLGAGNNSTYHCPEAKEFISG
jgi:hypothetical protein